MFMQIWDHQIFTLKIPLKCLGPNFDTQNSTQTCGVYLANMQVWLNQSLTPQNSTNMDFSMRWSQHFDLILIQELIWIINFKLK